MGGEERGRVGRLVALSGNGAAWFIRVQGKVYMGAFIRRGVCIIRVHV